MKALIGFLDYNKAKRKDFGSEIIRWFQASPIVHVFIVIIDDDLVTGERRQTVWETTETVYHQTTLADRIINTPAELFEIPTEHPELIEATCRRAEGAFYDYYAFVGLGAILLGERLINFISWPLRWLWGKLNKGDGADSLQFVIAGNPAQFQSMYFCSEIAINAIRDGLVKLPEWWKSEAILPRYFYKYVLDQGWPRWIP